MVVECVCGVVCVRYVVCVSVTVVCLCVLWMRVWCVVCGVRAKVVVSV